MPLTMARVGEPLKVKKVGGLDETRRFLNNLGFTEGADIRIVSSIAGNMIVQVRDARIAVDKDMAKKIMV